MIRLIEDLRFFIGTFFLIIGALLLVQGLRFEVLTEGYNLNLLTGIVFLLFGTAALTKAICACRN